MEYKKLGKSNLNASVIGFGGWGITGDLGKVSGEKDIIYMINEAYNLGINFFDTSPAYGVAKLGMQGYGTSEKLLGKSLKSKRDKVIIATKFGAVGDYLYDNSRKIILREIDESLKRLQTEYIDLYQVHWPDPNTSIKETFSTLNHLKDLGKIRYIGVCNYPINLIEEGLKYSEIISSQNLYNMIQRNSDYFYDNPLRYKTEKEILPYCEKKELGFIPYSPFCQGLLTGNKLNLNNVVLKNNPEFIGEKLEKNLQLIKQLKKVSERINKPLSQIVLNWLRKDNRITTIIAGPTKISEIRENVRSVAWSLDDDTYSYINNLLV